MQGRLKAYLAIIRKGADPVVAFKTEVDPDFKGFERQLRAYMNRDITYSRMMRRPPASVAVKVETLSPTADIALLPLVSLQLPQRAETDARNLEQVRSAANRYPEDSWARRARAIAEAIAGDKAGAQGLLDAEIAKAPDDAGLLRWRARLYRAYLPDAPPADVSAARRLLVRAHKAEPANWLVLSDYVNTFTARATPLPKEALDVLLLAHVLAPQVSQLAMKAGLQHAMAGDYSAALAAIEPVVNNPHSGSAMVLERGLVAALQSGRKGDVDAALEGLAAGARSLPPTSQTVNRQH